MKKLHKYIIAPTIVSTTMLSASVVIGYINSVETYPVGAHSSSEKSSTHTDSLLDTITSSFTNKAFADSDGYDGSECYNMSFDENFSDVSNICDDVTVDPINVCIKEGESTDITAHMRTRDWDYIRPVHAHASQGTSIIIPLIIAPTEETYSYGSSQQTFSTTVTAPLISQAESEIIETVDIEGTFDYDNLGGTWSNPQYKTVQANIRVDNINTAPTLTLSPSTGTEITLDSASETRDYTASATVNDDEGNITNLTFNLRQNGTIVQTQVYPNVAPGATIEHTFTGLTQGSYTWDVSAIETDARGTCAGYANADPPVNLQASAQGPDITLIYTQDGIILNGLIYNDLNDNDTHNEGEDGLPDITVTVTDSQGVEHVVVTDSEGRFSLPVPSGTTTIQVDQNDPDLPAGVTLANNGSWTVEIPESESEYTVAYAVGRELLPETSSQLRMYALLTTVVTGTVFGVVYSFHSNKKQEGT
ncbi:MAG: carboxypeptidase-like regulatory domain-containing protein [Candidatus Dojkabacteria bacterium]